MRNKIEIWFVFQVILISFICATSLAEENFYERTQIFWQPFDRKSAFALTGILSQTTPTNLNTANQSIGDTTTSAQTIAVRYSYGISSTWAVTIGLSTTPTQTQTTLINGNNNIAQTSGPDDLVFDIRGITSFSKWHLHYGLATNLSFDMNQPATASSQGNNYSGGDGATPYLGATFIPMENVFAGLRLSYFYRGQRILDPGRSLITTQMRVGKDRGTITTFIEWHTTPWHFDFRGSSSMINQDTSSGFGFNRTIGGYTMFTEELGSNYFYSHNLMLRIAGSASQVPKIPIGTTLFQDPESIYTAEITLRYEY